MSRSKAGQKARSPQYHAINTQEHDHFSMQFAGTLACVQPQPELNRYLKNSG